MKVLKERTKVAYICDSDVDCANVSNPLDVDGGGGFST